VAVSQADDPFGSRHRERGPGWLRIVAGLLIVLGGIGLTVYGIAGAVDAAGKVEGDAVGRATVRDNEVRDVVRFTVPEGERRRYTVWMLFDGYTSNDDLRELMVRDTGCAVDLPGGDETRFRGARQGTSVVLGDAATVGTFTSAAGEVRVRCAYITGTLRSERRRESGVPYVVTPGGPSEFGSDVLLIVGGVFGAIGGGIIAAWGWSRRRRYLRSSVAA
jgi:hypothetical protein